MFTYEAMHDKYQSQRRKLASEDGNDIYHIRRVAATTKAKRRELAWLTPIERLMHDKYQSQRRKLASEDGNDIYHIGCGSRNERSEA